MSNSLIERLSREVPLVVINRQVTGLPAVVMDVGQGARLAIDHLIGLGHRELALLGGPARILDQPGDPPGRHRGGPRSRRGR